VRLRELTGEDQAFLVEEAGRMLPARWTTELLHRCAYRADTGEPTPYDWLRSRTVGERDALVMELRRLSAGDRLQCVLDCPAENCRAKLDLELQVTDLLVPPGDVRREVHEAQVSESGKEWHVRFRLPTGGDQEAAAELAREDLDAAVDLLLDRLVESTGELPEAVRCQLPQIMSQFDPQAEINLRVTCCACGGAFDVLFDPCDYFRQELTAESRRFFHEVHLLAFHYHWSLADILRMSTGSRKRFLRLLEEELGIGAA